MSLMACLGRGTRDATNLIRNGSFVSHVSGWYPTFTDPPEYVGGSTRTANSGCMSVAALGGTVVYLPNNQMTRIDSLSTITAEAYVKVADADALSTISLEFFNDPTGATLLGTASSGATAMVVDDWTLLQINAAAVPLGSTHVLVRIDCPTTEESNVAGLIDDVYLGAPGGNVAPYLAADPIPLDRERIPNGTFETNITGWSGWSTSETLEHETANPIAGTGSLTVTTSGEDGEGVFVGTPYGPKPIVVPGEDIEFGFKIRGTGEYICTLFYSGFGDVQVWTDTLAGAVEDVSLTVTVPAGANFVFPVFTVVGALVNTFTIDDVTLGSA